MPYWLYKLSADFNDFKKEKKTTLKFNFNLLCVCSHQFPEIFATVWTGEWCENMRNFIGKNKIKQSRKWINDYYQWNYMVLDKFQPNFIKKHKHVIILVWFSAQKSIRIFFMHVFNRRPLLAVSNTCFLITYMYSY